MPKRFMQTRGLRPKIVFQLQDVKDIVIAKMDATANDVPPPYQVQG